MAARTTVVVPDLGDFHDVEVIDVLVKAGDAVAVDAPLITLETDKATMDVPSTAAGRVAEVPVKKGDRVSKGSPVIVVETTSASAPAAEPAAEPPRAAKSAPAPATPKSAPPAAAASIDVRVPDLGDFKDVEVIEVLVKEGDTVALETPLITLETEKATMDVPSSAAGTIVKIAVGKGSRVNAGDVVARVHGSGAAAPAAAASPAPAAPAAAAPNPEATVRMSVAAATRTEAAPPADIRAAHASPSVRRFARELGVDLLRVTGSGFKGRISEDDVKAFVKKALSAQPRTEAAGAALPRVPDVDFKAFGPVEVKPLGRIQKISGGRLQAAWVNIPHVTQHDEADITEMEKLRVSLKDRAAGLGIKLTPLAFIARACAKVIAQFPNFNSSLDVGGQNQVFKKYLHLGFAADTPNGLVVPVIRDAGRKDIYELARNLGELAGKARAGKLTAAEMQGGCFTISSLGGIGGTAFTPIINAPEVAILGVSRSQQRPVWREGKFEPRLMLPLSLSYDHRVIDGAEAVRFVVALAESLAQPAALTEAVP
ncbi:MAG TPA: dihydrolipoyllysine-residue acetyltransferase [Steroidobacteraceae bacterium]|nr:dihydrolipoyllysine-residue acetyltransferase [Steroidobacteraceae bacterium]